MKETAAQAWERIYGTRYEATKTACVHFTAGWNAGQGLA